MYDINTILTNNRVCEFDALSYRENTEFSPIKICFCEKNYYVNDEHVISNMSEKLKSMI